MPEIVRDFFWDDHFRSKWDDMLAYSETISECPTTGTMVVQWIRKVILCIIHVFQLFSLDCMRLLSHLLGPCSFHFSAKTENT